MSRLILLLVISSLTSCLALRNHSFPESVQSVLENSDQMELISLDPSFLEKKEKEGFHGWKVLGKVSIKDAQSQKSVLATIEDGIAKHDGSVALCFNPRHGLHVTQEGKTVDLILCFECNQIQIFLDGERLPDILVGRKPQTLLDGLLKEGKIPLAEKP